MAVRLSSEVNLPTNPNCVLFAAEASDALSGRSWADVQRIAALALRKFNDASGLAAEVAFAWRVNLDRMNRRHTQVTMMFIIDGPARAEHLGLIEAVASSSAIDWVPSCIERVPANAIHNLLVQDGRLYQLWTESEGENHAYRLVIHGSGVRLHRTTPARARADAFLPGLIHAVGRRVQPADRDLEKMRLAFAQHYARRVIEADGRVLPDEEEFMESVFPIEALHQLGLADPIAREYWFDQASFVLSERLGHHDKLALVGLLFSACFSDGSLDAREMKVLKEAGEALALTREMVVEYLQRFW